MDINTWSQYSIHYKVNRNDNHYLLTHVCWLNHNVCIAHGANSIYTENNAHELAEEGRRGGRMDGVERCVGGRDKKKKAFNFFLSIHGSTNPSIIVVDNSYQLIWFIEYSTSANTLSFRHFFHLVTHACHTLQVKMTFLATK